MKNPTPASVALISALVIGLISVLLRLINQAPWWQILAEGALMFAVAYGVILYGINYFIYRKIKLVYKTIYELKSNKFNSLMSRVNLQKDPLNEVNREVLQWAKDKSLEINQLKRMEEYRKEFFGNVSHELKTPIFNLQGYIHTLLDGALSDQDIARHFLKKAAKSADRMEALVADLLKIAQLEDGSIRLDIEIFDVHEMIRDIFESLELKAKSKGINLTFKQGIIPPFYVEADKKQIRQVLVNLIVNSIKYGKQGGATLVGIYDMDSYYLIELSDNGEGIEREHLPRLFERFYRIDKGRSREEGGTGLGLAIVKHIIEAHNQTINVRSSPGIGSTFGFTLKKADNK